MKIRAALALVLSAVVLAPIAGKAADDEETGRKACMYDALTMCAKFIPDRQAIANCLVATASASHNPVASWSCTCR